MTCWGTFWGHINCRDTCSGYLEFLLDYFIWLSDQAPKPPSVDKKRWKIIQRASHWYMKTLLWQREKYVVLAIHQIRRSSAEHVRRCSSNSFGLRKDVFKMCQMNWDNFNTEDAVPRGQISWKWRIGWLQHQQVEAGDIICCVGECRRLYEAALADFYRPVEMEDVKGYHYCDCSLILQNDVTGKKIR